MASWLKSSILLGLVVKPVTISAAMETEFTENERVLTDLSAEIAQLNDKMKQYLADIIEVSRFHRTCSS